jgi:hypothetical protein
MFASRFLGQVQLRHMGQTQMRAGTGFTGPFGIYSDVSHVVGNAPAGFPATTQEEVQTYICPDGTRQNMTRAEAAANGCVLASSLLGSGRPAAAGKPFLGQVSLLLGQGVGPSSPGTTSAPAGTPTGQAIANAGQPTMTRPADLFAPPLAFPGYPGYYPPTPSSGKLTCRRNVDADGNETFDCEPKSEPAAPQFRYPVYFMNPLFY